MVLIFIYGILILLRSTIGDLYLLRGQVQCQVMIIDRLFPNNVKLISDNCIIMQHISYNDIIESIGEHGSIFSGLV